MYVIIEKADRENRKKRVLAYDMAIRNLEEKDKEETQDDISGISG